MYLIWYDDTKKKATEEKILEGVERYIERFGETPNVCLVNPAQVVPAAGIDVRPTPYVRANNYWLGVERVSAPRKAAPRTAAPRRSAKKAA